MRKGKDKNLGMKPSSFFLLRIYALLDHIETEGIRAGSLSTREEGLIVLMILGVDLKNSIASSNGFDRLRFFIGMSRLVFEP